MRGEHHGRGRRQGRIGGQVGVVHVRPSRPAVVGAINAVADDAGVVDAVVVRIPMMSVTEPPGRPTPELEICVYVSPASMLR